ncbi:hypothetical protein Bmul_3484 [Burkholderia multivorans ATCC 17616]|nr:hypothetical protein Bmul_3484 [Burkholderia multivorans ATCC 17616]
MYHSGHPRLPRRPRRARGLFARSCFYPRIRPIGREIVVKRRAGERASRKTSSDESCAAAHKRVRDRPSLLAQRVLHRRIRTPRRLARGPARPRAVSYLRKRLSQFVGRPGFFLATM